MLTAGRKLNLNVLLRRAMDICSGLHEVHDMNVEMRDLKPVSCIVSCRDTAACRLLLLLLQGALLSMQSLLRKTASEVWIH